MYVCAAYSLWRPERVWMPWSGTHGVTDSFELPAGALGTESRSSAGAAPSLQSSVSAALRLCILCFCILRLCILHLCRSCSVSAIYRLCSLPSLHPPCLQPSISASSISAALRLCILHLCILHLCNLLSLQSSISFALREVFCAKSSSI